MNKTPDNREPKRLDAASRVGLFDVAIKKTGIIAKQGEGFTFHYPYGIIGIKSDPASVTEFIGLLKKFELDISNDESIMDCHIDPAVLEKGGAIVWEAPRYGMKKNHITLWEWLSKNGNVLEKGQEPYNVVDLGDRRAMIKGTLGGTSADEGTGTDGI
jgi:hypothetical protein